MTEGENPGRKKTEEPLPPGLRFTNYWRYCGCSSLDGRESCWRVGGLWVMSKHHPAGARVSSSGSLVMCWQLCQRNKAKNRWESGKRSPFLFSAFQFSSKHPVLANPTMVPAAKEQCLQDPAPLSQSNSKEKAVLELIGNKLLFIGRKL